MKHLSLGQLLLLLFGQYLVLAQNSANCEPKGIHISFGEYYYMTLHPKETMFYLQFYTEERCAENQLVLVDQNHTRIFNNQAIEMYDKLQPDAANSNSQLKKPFKKYIHLFAINNLNGFGKNYTYYIAYDSGQHKRGPFYFSFSRPFHFLREPNSVVVISNFDTSNYSQPTYNLLSRMAEKNMDDIRAIIHVGGIGLNLEDNYGEKGLQYMAAAEKFAAFIPYMTIPGNQENTDLFSYYRAFYHNPHHSEKQYPSDLIYSWNVGNMHFIGLNLEVYGQFQHLLLRELEDDLMDAVHKQIRDEYPWIIVYMHQPLYCSCNESTNATNSCQDNLSKFEFIEELFHRYEVDLVISSHALQYERSYPVYKSEVAKFNAQLHNLDESFYSPCNIYEQGGQCNVYQNPTAPVYVTEGVAGNALDPEAHGSNGDNPKTNQSQNWSAVRNHSVGYGIIKSKEDNVLVYQHLSSIDNSIIDRFEIVWHNRQSFQDNSQLIPQSHGNNPNFAEIFLFVLFGIIGLGLGIGIVYVIKNFIRWKKEKRLIQFEEQDLSIKQRDTSGVKHYELKNIDDNS